MWFVYALLSAVAAAFVAIFGKMGVKNIDPTVATTVRAVIMTAFLLAVSFLLQKFEGFTLGSLTSREWLFIMLAGVAGALSWLFYFIALKVGDVNAVVAIDRLSIVFVVILAALFVGEALTVRTVTGALLMVLGAIIISPAAIPIKEYLVSVLQMAFHR